MVVQATYIISKPIRAKVDAMRLRGYFGKISIERLWWTVKYEHVYLHSYDFVHTAWCGLNNYFKFYNEERLHGLLNKRTPHEVYFQQH